LFTQQQSAKTEKKELIQLLGSVLHDLGLESDIDRISVQPFHRSKYSRVFRVDHPKLPISLAVKCISPDANESAATQYNALKKISATFGSAGKFRVPEALAVDDENGIVVMEWIDIPNIEASLKRWRAGLPNSLQIVADAGKWIHQLHSASNLQSGRLKSEQLAEGLSRETQNLATLYPRKAALTKFIHSLQETASAVSEIDLPRGLQHGDFKPANILSDLENTVAIDCHAIHEGPVVFDLAHFMNHLEFALLSPLGITALRRREQLTETFLRAYDDAGIFATHAKTCFALTWLRLYAISNLWISETNQEPSFLRSEYHYWCYRYVGNSLHQKILKFSSR
jgi:serine/threonine protein kinase